MIRDFKNSSTNRRNSLQEKQKSEDKKKLKKEKFERNYKPQELRKRKPWKPSTWLVRMSPVMIKDCKDYKAIKIESFRYLCISDTFF